VGKEANEINTSTRVEYVPRVGELEGWCSGCRICETICSMYNEGISNPKISRIKIISWEPSIDVPIVCKQCVEPLCAKSCPVEAFKKNDNGILEVDQELCIGCGACVESCPFGAITVNPITGKMSKCNLCGGQPLCIEYCPADVIKLMTSKLRETEKAEEWAKVLQKQKEIAGKKAKEQCAGGE
jgi:Fe-S-cluster-containing hydrogenase component 2